MSSTPDPPPPTQTPDSGKLAKWFQRCNPCSGSEEARHRNRKMVELFAFSFVIIMSFMVYVYGILRVLPLMLKDQNSLIQFLFYFSATWCALGIWLNLVLMMYRDSRILKKNLRRVEPLKPGNLSGQDQEDPPKCEPDEWHICPDCKLWVPPRAWHCKECQTCILRRDHHCVFAMTCIGQNNHVNFMGFLAYLAIGATYTIIVGVFYVHNHLKTTVPEYVLSAALNYVTCFLYFGFDFEKFLCPFTFMGVLASGIVFFFYCTFACANQTSADCSRGIKRSTTTKELSYANLTEFFGKNPIIRILWPLYPLPDRKNNEGHGHEEGTIHQSVNSTQNSNNSDHV